MTPLTPRLVAISDRRGADAETILERFAEIARVARPKSVVFMLRDGELPARERFSFGMAMRLVASAEGQLFVVSDRVDLAVLLAADGVHLGEDGMATADARRLLGEHALVSRACHEPALVPSLDADAVLLSPILESRKGRSALGLEGLATASGARVGEDHLVRLYALGGVSAIRVPECLAAGADGIAVMGAALRGEGGDLVRALGIAR